MRERLDEKARRKVQPPNAARELILGKLVITLLPCLQIDRIDILFVKNVETRVIGVRIDILQLAYLIGNPAHTDECRASLPDHRRSLSQ